MAEEGCNVIGYAYAGQFRQRAAYKWSAEVSVYIDMDNRARGVGRALMIRLLDELRAREFANAFAGVTLPNAASVALHARFGFQRVGQFSENGRKFGRYWDVAWFERPLRV